MNPIRLETAMYANYKDSRLAICIFMFFGSREIKAVSFPYSIHVVDVRQIRVFVHGCISRQRKYPDFHIDERFMHDNTTYFGPGGMKSAFVQYESDMFGQKIYSLESLSKAYPNDDDLLTLIKSVYTSVEWNMHTEVIPVNTHEIAMFDRFILGLTYLLSSYHVDDEISIIVDCVYPYLFV